MDIKIDLEFITKHHITATTSLIRSGNIGAVALRNFVCLIDASGYKIKAEKFVEKLENYYELPVKYLIYTHYHGDHIFGASAFKDRTILSSYDTYYNLKGRSTLDTIKEWKSELLKDDPYAEGIEIILPTICFEDKLFIRDEDLQVEIYHTGGHTSGSSIVCFPKEKIAFSGDLIFNEIYPYAGDPTCNPDVWISQLEQIESMNVDKIVPGHGSVLHSKKELKKHIQFYKTLRTIIRDAVKEGLPVDKIEPPDFFEFEAEVWKPVAVENWSNFYKNQSM